MSIIYDNIITEFSQYIDNLYIVSFVDADCDINTVATIYYWKNIKTNNIKSIDSMVYTEIAIMPRLEYCNLNFYFSSIENIKYSQNLLVFKCSSTVDDIRPLMQCPNLQEINVNHICGQASEIAFNYLKNLEILILEHNCLNIWQVEYCTKLKKLYIWDFIHNCYSLETLKQNNKDIEIKLLIHLQE
jgi:hypothetical protein